MHFRIADTFTDSLAKLNGQEQKAAKTTAFDLQMNPASPGLKFHRIDKSKDPNFWSLRVNRDIRMIVHKTAASVLLCYVDHHDDAYAWAERRRIEVHPKTGAAQLVELQEVVEKGAAPAVGLTPTREPTKDLFSAWTDDELLSYGVPEEWLARIRTVDEGQLLEITDHLPQEAAEALLELAVGSIPETVEPVPETTDPFEHPDAQRRFRLFTDIDELKQALEYPWEKWTVFLHPAQRRYVERSYNGPARVAGSAGTGKTIVALHRAVFLARHNPDARVLLTTFSRALSNTLKAKLEILVGNDPKVGKRITVMPIKRVGFDLYAEMYGEPKLASMSQVRDILKSAGASEVRNGFSPRFLETEWRDVVDAWQLGSWEDYRDVARLGRKTRVGGKQRQQLWTIYEDLRQKLSAMGLSTWADVFGKVTGGLGQGHDRPYDFAVIDEAQDISVPELRFLAALIGDRPNGLFFAGDLGQRIFQVPFSWKALGVDIRGRSATLKVNYRTSHQIRRQADQLLPRSIADVDGNEESRKGTVSVFNGPPPRIDVFETPDEEIKGIGGWIKDRLGEGIAPAQIGLIVRSTEQIDRAKTAAESAGCASCTISEEMIQGPDQVAISTMHLAKGLEFRAVAVMACDDEVIPLQERVETVTDESDLEEVYNTERHLLYVACTRARDHLIVSGVDPASEFLDDFAVSP